jgi:hypothetical protein
VSESDGDPESSHPVTTHASDPQDSVDEYAHTDEVATLHICRHYFGTRFETGILILVLAFVWTGHSGVEEWAPGGVEGWDICGGGWGFAALVVAAVVERASGLWGFAAAESAAAVTG